MHTCISGCTLSVLICFTVTLCNICCVLFCSAMKHGLLCEVDIPQEELDKRVCPVLAVLYLTAVFLHVSLTGAYMRLHSEVYVH